LNYKTGDVVAGGVFARLGKGGKVDIYSLAQTHLVVDVTSYQSENEGDFVVPVNPTRLYSNSFGTKQARTIQLAPLKSVPESASSVTCFVLREDYCLCFIK
jgi:hypothetical protein